MSAKAGIQDKGAEHVLQTAAMMSIVCRYK
jgi:hypothetical protein